jgi:hypothetical protein
MIEAMSSYSSVWEWTEPQGGGVEERSESSKRGSRSSSSIISWSSGSSLTSSSNISWANRTEPTEPGTVVELAEAMEEVEHSETRAADRDVAAEPSVHEEEEECLSSALDKGRPKVTRRGTRGRKPHRRKPKG